MKFSIKTQCFTTRYYVVEAKSKAKAEKLYWDSLGTLEEQKEFTREDQHEVVSITKEEN